MLPFARDAFVAVFADYNAAVWPARIVAPLLGAAIASLLLWPAARNDRLTGIGLALMWIWTGVAYHALFFAPLNPVAWAFAALFVLQGALLLEAATLRGVVVFGVRRGPAAWLGWALVVYPLVFYPLVGMLAGQRTHELPSFGITPCPVTLFTLGLLVLTPAPVPWRLLVVPFAWSLIGTSAAVLLEMPQDWPLLLGAVAVPWIVLRDRRPALSDMRSPPAGRARADAATGHSIAERPGRRFNRAGDSGTRPGRR